MKNRIAYLAIAFPLIGLSSGVVFAASTGTKGQPSQSCEDLAIAAMLPPGAFTPGNSFFSQGTFNGGGTSAQHYAGNGADIPNGNASANANPESQYDVACFQQSQPLP